MPTKREKILAKIEAEDIFGQVLEEHALNKCRDERVKEWLLTLVAGDRFERLEAQMPRPADVQARRRRYAANARAKKVSNDLRKSLNRLES